MYFFRIIFIYSYCWRIQTREITWTLLLVCAFCANVQSFKSRVRQRYTHAQIRTRITRADDDDDDDDYHDDTATTMQASSARWRMIAMWLNAYEKKGCMRTWLNTPIRIRWWHEQRHSVSLATEHHHNCGPIVILMPNNNADTLACRHAGTRPTILNTWVRFFCVNASIKRVHVVVSVLLRERVVVVACAPTLRQHNYYVVC